MSKRPRVGIGVCIKRENKVLLGKRKNAHGEGDWSFPGGHLEYKESWEECAEREILEETGLKIKKFRFGTVTNDIFEKDDKHYITIILVTDYVDGEAEIIEPHKCEKWEWFEWGNLPELLFCPIQNLLKQNFNPFEENFLPE